MRLHRYQRESLECLLGDGVRTGGLQIPRGNAKSTLWAAVGLWALCDHPDAPQVPLVAKNGIQAMRTLMRPIRNMVRANPELSSRIVVYTSTTDRRVWSAWNDGDLVVLPADAERLQGLNPTVALVDEAEAVAPEVFGAVLQGAGKRAASLVLAIGTPAPGAQSSALFQLRERAAAGAPVAWVEYAADAGCAIDDRSQWAKANPALRAGLLYPDALAGELQIVSEVEFRTYRLGQWVDATLADWLPGTAWDDCPHADPPPDGAEIVLAVAASWRSTVAVVGATPDGAIFHAYSGTGEYATDETIDEQINAACHRWNVVEVVVAPRTRANLVRYWQDLGAFPVWVWPNTVEVDAASSTEWRRAIVEGRVAHDHDPELGEQVAALVGRPTADGSLRLGAPDDETPVDRARAARMAWWRAIETEGGAAPMIY